MNKKPVFDRAALADITSLGLQIAIIMAMGFFGGFWLDRKVGSLPAFTLLCSAAAFAAAIYFVVKSVKNR